MAEKLQYIASEIMECGYGWLEPVQMFVDFVNWHNSCNEEQVVIDQIKEKWGDLVIYTHGTCEGLSEMKEKVKELASHTCEVCGSKDNVGTKYGSWIVTMCRKCTQDMANNTKRELKWRPNKSKEVEIICPIEQTT